MQAQLGSEFTKYSYIDSPEYQEYTNCRDARIEEINACADAQIYDVAQCDPTMNVYDNIPQADSKEIKAVVQTEIDQTLAVTFPTDPTDQVIETMNQGESVYLSESNPLAVENAKVEEMAQVSVADEISNQLDTKKSILPFALGLLGAYLILR